MRYKSQAGIVANVSYSKVSLSSKMNLVVSLDHFALSFLFCRWVKISALCDDNQQTPQN